MYEGMKMSRYDVHLFGIAPVCTCVVTSTVGRYDLLLSYSSPIYYVHPVSTVSPTTVYPSV